MDADGVPVVGEVGELVITGADAVDADPPLGRRGRLALPRELLRHVPGVWRHGDWIEITERGTAIITGRSDATINRGGIRMGTAEIYRAVLSLDEVVDALVVDLPREGRRGTCRCSSCCATASTLDDDLVARIRARIREDCSPRHVPDEIRRIAEVPRTLSGKVLEVPVKRILCGEPADTALSRDSLANPDALRPVRGARRNPRMEERMTYVADADRYERMPYRRTGRSGLQLPGDLARPLEQLRGRPPARDEPRDRPPCVRPRDHALRPREQLRAAVRLGRGDVRPAPRDRPRAVPGRARDLDEGRLRHVARALRRVGLPEVPLASLDQSLRRMGLDYVDIFYSHRLDPDTPLEETMGALDTRRPAGEGALRRDLVLSAGGDARGAAILERLGTPLLIHQPSYSMLNRWIEDGLLDALGELGVGCIGFSPLAQGPAHRPLRGRDPGGLADRPRPLTPADQLTDQTMAKVAALREIAAGRGQTLPRWRSRGRSATRG